MAGEATNSVSHGVGIVLSIAGLVISVARASVIGSVPAIIVGAIFEAALILMRSASTLYHAISNAAVKPHLRKRHRHHPVWRAFVLAGSVRHYLAGVPLT